MAVDVAKLEVLFESLLAVAPGEREAWIGRHVPEQLRGEVARLVRADASNVAEGLGSAGEAGEVGAEGLGEMPTQIQGYRVLEPLARTPTSMIVLAVQRVTGRRCALKLLGTALEGPGTSVLARERFLLEAEIVARLNHPGIVQVYDAGHARAEFADGRAEEFPFIAMEHVDGLAITRYVRERGLSLRHCVSLLLRVGEAVRHAHEHGVLHRDLKPTHVLVSRDGTPKLIDFGIGAMSTLGRPPAFDPRDRWISGTPAYMSPEQAAGRPEDARADIFALGLVMHECLSTRAGGARGAAGRGGRTPGGVPERLGSVRPECAGDLEAVVHRAMEASPERRYASAAALVDDLQRVLSGEPVEARPLGRLRRLGRLVRRRPLLSGLVGASGLALLIAAGMMVGSAMATARAGRRTEEALRQSDAALGFASDLLAAAAPVNAGPSNPLLGVMERRVNDSLARFQDQPLTVASIRYIWGGVLQSVGRGGEALEHFRGSYLTRAKHLGEEAEPTLEALMAYGSALRFETEEVIPTYEQAGELLERAASTAKRVLGPEHATTIRAHVLLAKYYDSVSNYTGAISVLRGIGFESPDGLIGLGGRRGTGLSEQDQLELFHVAKAIGEYSYNRIGDGEQALRVFLAASENAGKMLRRMEGERLELLMSVVRSLQVAERPEEARLILETILPEIDAHYGRQHPIWSFAQLRMAELTEWLGDPEAAEEAYAELIPLAAQSAVGGYRERRVMSMMVSVARTRLNRGDFTACEALLRQVLPMQLDPDGLACRGRDSAQGLITMTRVLLAQGRARDGLWFALLANGAVLGDVGPYTNHPGRAWVLAWIGRCYEELKELELAQAFYEEASCIRTSMGLNADEKGWPRWTTAQPPPDRLIDHRGVAGLDPMVGDCVFAHLRVLHFLGLSNWEERKRLDVLAEIAGVAEPRKREHMANQMRLVLEDTGGLEADFRAAREAGEGRGPQIGATDRASRTERSR